MSGVAVGENLNGGAAEGIGEAAGLGLHVGGGGDTGREGGEDEGVAADVGQVGDFLRAEGGGEVGGAGIHDLGFGGDDDLVGLGAYLEGKVTLEVGSCGEGDAGPGLGADGGMFNGDGVGARRQEGNGVAAGVV